MYYSLFEIFSIGVGPSSSHTVGPMRAAKRYLDNLKSEGCFPLVKNIKVTLYGSLALTGVGHGTVKAIIYGLMGLEAEAIDPGKPYVVAVERDGILHLGQERAINFNLKEDIVFAKDTFLQEHSNGMKFSAFSEDGTELLSEIYFSIGGGTIARQDEIGRRISRKPYNVPYQFDTCQELLNIAEKQNLSISDIVLQNEVCLRPEKDVYSYIEKIHQVMQNSIERGIKAEGTLGGGLGIRRRAGEIFKSLQDRFEKNNMDSLMIIDWLNLWGFAVAEENASGGQIVTAPTMGSAGIMPSVIRYYERFAHHKSTFNIKDGIIRFLTTASAICSLYRSNASISGAEVGCQGEVGVACSMAAAGLVAAMGGTNYQIENAAEIAMEHNLGLTCDPVGGLVQVPCIERNAMGAVKAVNAARLAYSGEGKHLVSLDSVIKTMYFTGIDMNTRYKETSLGGLAKHITNC
ncbi:MAG: L-serine ammonia-lyase [Alphaproteobacteria bacterium]|nr:L-serine ammonia-lyase [Alphaproteobacteria bacterium]